MEQLTVTPTSSFENQVARLEQENHNLIKRVEKLEKAQRFSVSAFLGNVLLLVALGLLAGYLGLYPPGVERLPIKAKVVETDQVILRSADGHIRGHLTVDDKGFHTMDDHGKALAANP
jgi:hypothetical protein